MAEAARYMADSLFIPLSARNYADGLRQFIVDLEKGYGKMMTDNGISLGLLLALLKNERLNSCLTALQQLKVISAWIL